MNRDMMLILDFGGTQAQSLARRVRSSGVYCEVLPCDTPVENITGENVRGILMAGDGRREGSADVSVWNAGLPVLAMGFSARKMAEALGGRDMGAVLTEHMLELELTASPLFESLTGCERYIHRLDALELPEGFDAIAQSDGMTAAFANEEKKLYGMQFEIESNDPDGLTMLDNFLSGICGCERWWSTEAFMELAIPRIREQVGGRNALMALSGGVDSSVCAALMLRAIGSQLHCIYVDTGLMRKGDTEMVRRVFLEDMGIQMTVVDARARFLARLRGITDPAEKWRAVSEEFAAIYEEEARKLPSVDFLVQGTIYTDVLDGYSKDDFSASGMETALIEPVRELFKDEVRELGEKLGLPPEVVGRQSFPGAGLGIRIIGEVTEEKLHLLREADAIWHEEILQAGLNKRIRRYFAVLSETASSGEKHCSLVVALRALGAAGSSYTAYRMPYDLLERVTERILTELPQVDRVVYDTTTTPPRPTEWE